MRTGRKFWDFHDRNLMNHHASQYPTCFDAVREFQKNLEQAGAKTICNEFLPKSKTVLIYGDGTGMNDTVLNQIMENVADSPTQNLFSKNVDGLKSTANHGVGAMACFRFCPGMRIFSRSNGKIYVLSCETDEKTKGIYTSTGDGGAREVDADLYPEDREYKQYYSKLNRFTGDGTITIFENIGQNTGHYDWGIKMKEDFNPAKFKSYMRDNYSQSLASYTYLFKENEESQLLKIQPKRGIGIKKEFTIPDRQHPEKLIPGKAKVHGKAKNCFLRGGFLYELVVNFLFHFSEKNDGQIHIGSKNENSILISNIKSGKIPSFYKNSEFIQYLTGYIEFKIKPLNGGQPLNVYTGNRDTLILNDDFGDCLCNILHMAATDVLQPEAERKIEQASNKNKGADKECQKIFERWFQDERFQSILKKLGNTTTYDVGPVQDNSIKCPGCDLRFAPKRGGTLKDIKNNKNPEAFIYIPDDSSYYCCGGCGHLWERREYKSSGGGEQTVKPIHTIPDEGEGKDRVIRHGFGYNVSVRPFSSDYNRIAMLKGDNTVWVNSNHQDYQAIQKSKIHTLWKNDALQIYRGQNGFEVIINHEVEKKTLALIKAKSLQNIPVTTDDLERLNAFRLEALQEMKNFILVDVQTTPKREKKGTENAPNSEKQSVTSGPTVQDLKIKWESK
jgi:hypothetical protein